jgi:hypothetical protein
MDTPRGEGFINSMSDSEFLLIIPCGTRNWAGGMRDLGLIKPLQRGGDAWNEKYPPFHFARLLRVFVARKRHI